MEDLMNNADLVEQIISLLDQATFMGGLAAIIFFLIPLLQLIVTAVAWVWGVSILARVAQRLLLPMTMKSDVERMGRELKSQLLAEVRSALPDVDFDEVALQHAIDKGVTYERFFDHILEEAGIDKRDFTRYPVLKAEKLERFIRGKKNEKVEVGE